MSRPTEPRTPYSDAHGDSGYTTRATTMAEVTAGLEGVLTRLVAGPEKMILIIEVGPTAAGVRDDGCRLGVCLRT
jgi:hypothetical protein